MLKFSNLDLSKYPIPRVRHHVGPQSYLPANQQHRLPAWSPPPIEEALWSEWFANRSAATVLDIGCGRGGFLLRHALFKPELNILGIEVRDSLVSWINSVVRGERIPNAHALWYSVANGLHWISDASVQYATYLFADPWPKKRHHKRRAFTQGFLDELYRVLIPNGVLYLATDRADVDDHQRSVLSNHGGFLINDLNPTSWPFPFPTDQQDFCNRKGIPYTLYSAIRNAR